MKAKKLLFTVIAIMLIAVTLIGTVGAANIAEAAEIENVTRAEETQWYYRVKDGVLERRLWSLTYERWLTEWEPVY